MLPLSPVSSEHSFFVRQVRLRTKAIYLGLLLPAWPGSYTKPPPKAGLQRLSMGLTLAYATPQACGPPIGDLR
jgi:hypothetical protein